MAKASQAEVVAGLAALWRRWTKIVHLLASRREGRYAADPDEYHRLHARLLELSRLEAIQGDPERQRFFQEIEQILAPWVSLESLSWAEREIVYKVLDRCEAVQRILDGRPAVRKKRNYAKLVLAGAVVLVVLAVGLSVCGLEPTAWPPVAAVRRYVTRQAREVVALDLYKQLLLGGVVTTVAVIAIVWHSARR